MDEEILEIIMDDKHVAIYMEKNKKGKWKVQWYTRIVAWGKQRSIGQSRIIWVPLFLDGGLGEDGSFIDSLTGPESNKNERYLIRRITKLIKIKAFLKGGMN